jgi:hypothetical protein
MHVPINRNKVWSAAILLGTIAPIYGNLFSPTVCVILFNANNFATTSHFVDKETEA